MSTALTITWPPKYDVVGSTVSATDYDQAEDCILNAAEQRQSAVVSCHAVHAVVTSSGDPALRAKVRSFEMVCPDGQPVRWALNAIYRTKLEDRVYGPELMLRLCRQAEQRGVSIYLYGGSPQTIVALETNLLERFPELRIVGSESPPYRPLTDEEDEAVVQRINDSGAGIVFIGLGCPKQDHFAFDHRDRLRAVQVCVGAAFDFHAGAQPMAPRWMQRHGLEWLFRLSREPRRLFGRYLVTNSAFLAKFAAAYFKSGRKQTETEDRSP